MVKYSLYMLSISLRVGGDFLFYWRAMEKKQELNVGICGNAANITVLVEQSFGDTYVLKMCATEEALGLLSYAKSNAVDILILFLENIVPVYSGGSNDYGAKYREILQMIKCLKSRYQRPIIIFSAFLIPENVQKELESAGADRVSVGWPIPPEKFREIILGFL
jgi:hypothetical protein